MIKAASSVERALAPHRLSGRVTATPDTQITHALHVL